MSMRIRSAIILLALLLSSSLADERRQYKYEFFGTYETGAVVSEICEYTGCRFGGSGDFVNLPLTLSVRTNSASELFKAINRALDNSGFQLYGSPTGNVRIAALQSERDSSYAFVSCLDGAVQLVPWRLRAVYERSDSLRCERAQVDTLPALQPVQYVFEYFGFNNTVLDNWGIDWTKILSSGDFYSKPSIPLSWAIKALGENDSLSQYRSLAFALDSSISIVWGNESKELEKTYTESGVVTQSYETRDYGLRIQINRIAEKVTLEYSFISNDDRRQKLSGKGSASKNDTLLIVGTYRDFENRVYYVPFLGKVPVLGELFRYRETTSEQKFFVLRLVPKLKE